MPLGGCIGLTPSLTERMQPVRVFMIKVFCCAFQAGHGHPSRRSVWSPVAAGSHRVFDPAGGRHQEDQHFDRRPQTNSRLLPPVPRRPFTPSRLTPGALHLGVLTVFQPGRNRFWFRVFS